jgi:hypothetical protein
MVIGGEKVESGSGGRSGKNGNKNPPAALSAKTGRGNSTTNNPSDYRDQGLPNAPSAIKPPGAGQRNTLDDLLTFGLPLWDIFWGKLERLLEWAKDTPLAGRTARFFSGLSFLGIITTLLLTTIDWFNPEKEKVNTIVKGIIGITIGVVGMATGATEVAFVAGVVWGILDMMGVTDTAIDNVEIFIDNMGSFLRNVYDGLKSAWNNIQWSYTEFLNNLRKAAEVH